MKTTKVEINGKEYTLCLSMGVLASYESEDKSAVDGINEVLNSGKLSGVLDLFQRMIEAGYKYEKFSGREANTLSLEELEMIIDPSDLTMIGEWLKDAVGMKAEVEVEDNPKNVKTSQGE